MNLRNESEVALHAPRETGLAEVVIIKLKALVTDADKRRLIAPIARDADVDKGALLSNRLLLLVLLLLLLLFEGRLWSCHCRLNNRRSLEGKGQVSLALHLNTVVLGALGGDADAALVGARDRHGLVHEAEFQADNQWVHFGRCNLHHTDSFEKLCVRADCNLVTVIINVGHGVGRASSDGGKALLEFFE